MIFEMVPVMNVILQEIGIEATLKTAKLMVLEFISGNQERSMMGTGSTDLKAVTECGKEKMEKST